MESDEAEWLLITPEEAVQYLGCAARFSNPSKTRTVHDGILCGVTGRIISGAITRRFLACNQFEYEVCEILDPESRPRLRKDLTEEELQRERLTEKMAEDLLDKMRRRIQSSDNKKKVAIESATKYFDRKQEEHNGNA